MGAGTHIIRCAASTSLDGAVATAAARSMTGCVARSSSFSSSTTQPRVTSSQANAAVVELASSGDWIMALCCLRGTEALGLRSSSHAYYSVMASTGQHCTSWAAALAVVKQLSLTQTSAAALARTAVTTMAVRNYRDAARVVDLTPALRDDPWCAALLLYHGRGDLVPDAFKVSPASIIAARSAVVMAQLMRSTRPGVSLPESLLVPALLASSQVGDWVSASTLTAACGWPTNGAATRDADRHAMVLCCLSIDSRRLLATAEVPGVATPSSARDLAASLEGLRAARQFPAMAAILSQTRLPTKLQALLRSASAAHRNDDAVRLANLLVGVARRVSPDAQVCLLEAWCHIAPASVAETAMDASWQALEYSASWQSACIAALRSIRSEGPPLSKLATTSLLHALTKPTCRPFPPTRPVILECPVYRAVICAATHQAKFVKDMIPGLVPFSTQSLSAAERARHLYVSVQETLQEVRAAKEMSASKAAGEHALRDFNLFVELATKGKHHEREMVSSVLKVLAAGANAAARSGLIDLALQLLAAWARTCEHASWQVDPPTDVLMSAIVGGADPGQVQALGRTVSGAAHDSHVRSYLVDFCGSEAMAERVMGSSLPLEMHPSEPSRIPNEVSTMFASVLHLRRGADMDRVLRFSVPPAYQAKMIALSEKAGYWAARKKERAFLRQLAFEAQSGKGNRRAPSSLTDEDVALLVRGSRCGNVSQAAAALLVSRKQEAHQRTRATDLIQFCKSDGGDLMRQLRNGVGHRARATFDDSDERPTLEATANAQRTSIALRLVRHATKQNRLTLGHLIDAMATATASDVATACCIESANEIREQWETAVALVQLGDGAVALARAATVDEADATASVVSGYTWAVRHVPSWCAALRNALGRFDAVPSLTRTVVGLLWP